MFVMSAKQLYERSWTGPLLFSIDNSTHHENTPIQIYWKFYNQTKEIFQMKNSDIFQIFA